MAEESQHVVFGTGEVGFALGARLAGAESAEARSSAKRVY